MPGKNDADTSFERGLAQRPRLARDRNLFEWRGSRREPGQSASKLPRTQFSKCAIW